MGYKPIFFDIETTGLNPMAQQWWKGVEDAARVTAVGVGEIDEIMAEASHDEHEYDVTVYWDESEYNLLQIVEERVEKKVAHIRDDGDEPFLVSFNGRNFDHPYIGARFSRLRLDGSVFTHRLKRLDMMRALGKHFPPVDRYPSEDDCLEVLGIESDDPHDGSDMPDAYSRGDWSAIQTHVSHDVEEMMRLFVETQGHCFGEFFDHYDIQQDVGKVEEYQPE